MRGLLSLGAVALRTVCHGEKTMMPLVVYVVLLHENGIEVKRTSRSKNHRSRQLEAGIHHACVVWSAGARD